MIYILYITCTLLKSGMCITIYTIVSTLFRCRLSRLNRTNLLLSFVFFLLFVCDIKSYSQVSIASSDSVTCTHPCATLTATMTGLSGSSTGLSTADDAWSSALNIGFTFRFYGIYYTQCIVGTNGEIGFDLTKAGGYNTWDITTTLAATAANAGGGSIGSDIHNLIAGPWCDLFL